MQSRLGALCLQSIDVGGAGDWKAKQTPESRYDGVLMIKIDPEIETQISVYLHIFS